jgi:hypothetical protein
MKFYLVYLSIPFPLLNIFFSLFHFIRVKRKELLKKKLLLGKGALGFDCFQLQNKMLPQQQK